MVSNASFSLFAFISVTIGTYTGMLAGTARTVSDGNQMDALTGPLVMLLVAIAYFRLRSEGMEDGMTFQGEEVESSWFTNGLLTFALIMGALFAIVLHLLGKRWLNSLYEIQQVFKNKLEKTVCVSVFTSALSGTCADVDTWHFVSYDQLSQDLLPEKKDVGLIFIETSWKASQLPYHKQKLALLLSNQRHFALEMQDAGYPVRYVFSEKEYGEVLSELCEELGEITVTKPSELSLRRSIQPLVDILAN